MTEDEARDWAEARFDRVSIERLERLAQLVIAESERQNLVARSTLGMIWSRHIVDSLQLLAFGQSGRWLDVGTGAGFPGLVIAAVEPDRDVLLVEPRRLRADYLRKAAAVLDLSHVTVKASRIEAVCEPAMVISARAVSRIGALFAVSIQCAREDTIWILPKGRTASEEVAEARRTWHGVFHVEQSITSTESSIVVARGVFPR